MNTRRKPNFAEENRLHDEGYHFIAGVDEVGRGSLMGPVVAAAVIMPEVVKGKWKAKVRDSKQLRPQEREYLFGFIKEGAVSVGIGMRSNNEIDTVGIAVATRLAMVDAIGQLNPEPQYLLIDFVKLHEVTIPQKGVIDGDSLVFSIASASIIAKVTRDHIVEEMDEEYPGYGFAEHKGYGTKAHLECLRHHGPCPLHRRSFSPVKELIDTLR